MKASDIATAAAELVAGDREQTHGSKHRNFENIATLWRAYLSIRLNPQAPVSALDHAHMMVLLKIARMQLGAYNPDDYTDMAGYAACAGEVAAHDAAPHA